MKKSTKIILLTIIILFNIFLAFYPHFTNPYPILSDEYVHLSHASTITEDHKLPFTNPYIPLKTIHLNFESGFHFFLAFIFTILPGDPILIYKYLIIIFMIINSLLLFHLTNLWFKNIHISLITVLLFGTIKSTGTFLGHRYFIPLTIGITLLLLAFIFLHKYSISTKNKNLYYLILTLIALTITYPPALFFFLGTTFLYLLSMDHNINQKFKLTKKQFLIYLISTLIILTIIFLITLNALNLLNAIIFTNLWTQIQENISPVFFFGILPTILALYGFIIIAKSKQPKIILYGILFSIIQIYLFTIFNFTILVPFRRLLMFYFILTSILAGVGSVAIISKLKKVKTIPYITPIAYTLLIVLILTNYFFINPSPEIREPFLTDELYEITNYINQNYPSKNLIIAKDSISYTIPASTKDYVMGITQGTIWGGFPEVAQNFILENCEGKKIALDQINYYKKEFNLSSLPILAITETKQNCEFINLKFNNKKYYLYEIQLTNN